MQRIKQAEIDGRQYVQAFGMSEARGLTEEKIRELFGYTLADEVAGFKRGVTNALGPKSVRA
jgi:hypothetical protein